MKKVVTIVVIIVIAMMSIIMVNVEAGSFEDVIGEVIDKVINNDSEKTPASSDQITMTYSEYQNALRQKFQQGYNQAISDNGTSANIQSKITKARAQGYEQGYKKGWDDAKKNVVLYGKTAQNNTNKTIPKW